MRANPFSDLVTFLIGNSGDQNALGPYKYLTVVFFGALIVGGLYVAWLNWSTDPRQRTAKHLWIFAMRFLMAGMWYQGSLWKLPWPVSSGFRYWLGASAKFSAFQIHADIMSVFVAHVAVVQPLVYLLEIFFTVSLMLGFAVRLTGIVAALFVLNLWIGLYNDPTEWAWTYIAIVVAHGMMTATEAGRSLGLDELVRRRPIGPFAGGGWFAWGYRLAS
jgi:uncharacterized membrane protein YphA (DoxX/SURF4 family)